MKVLVDVMCGTLAVYLRIGGHDAAYALDRNVEADEALRTLARAEGRTLLTRDRALVTRPEDAICVAGRDVRDQLRELRAAGMSLTVASHPVRCGRCNGSLDPVTADADTPSYAPDPDGVPVWCCGDCGQYFWKGSHWDDVRETLTAIEAVLVGKRTLRPRTRFPGANSARRRPPFQLLDARREGGEGGDQR